MQGSEKDVVEVWVRVEVFGEFGEDFGGELRAVEGEQVGAEGGEGFGDFEFAEGGQGVGGTGGVVNDVAGGEQVDTAVEFGSYSAGAFGDGTDASGSSAKESDNLAGFGVFHDTEGDGLVFISAHNFKLVLSCL